MRTKRTRLFAWTAVAAGALLAQAGAARTIYSRVDVLEGVAGRIDVRTAYARTLDVSLVDCPDGEPECSGEVTYSHLFGFDLLADAVTESAGVTDLTTRLQGRVMVALDLGTAAELAVDDLLAEAVANLSGTSFASFESASQPLLPYELLSLSKTPPRLCEIGERRQECHVLMAERPDYLKFVAAPDRNRLAGQLASALEGRAPRSFFTGMRATVEERVEVRFRAADDLTGVTWSDSLFVLPEEIVFERAAEDPARAGVTHGITREGELTGSARLRGLVREIVAGPAFLDPSGAPMWVGEWTLSKTRLEHGTRPAESPLGEERLIVALIPFRSDDYENDSFLSEPIRLNEEAIVSAAVRELRVVGRIDLEWIERARPDGEWIKVLCKADGSATYGIVPLPAEAEVTNARPLCRALASALDP